MNMVYDKSDGMIEFGHGIDAFQPGQKITGMHTNGPSTKWWRICPCFDHRPGPWILQPDQRNAHWRELAAAANSCEEFLEELTAGR